ncbi:MAG: hypothetical protein GY896_25795, partial [Gammaproteobacteria bacterium]|nr:hypothetical protein [Gammaproteobacteria bacterium]
PKSWTGAVSNLWSESGNWHTGTAPVDGDVLIFPNGVANQTNTNDIIGLDLESVSIGDNASYDISGNAITITGGITSGGGGSPKIWNVPITLAASQTFIVDGHLTLANSIELNGHTLTFDGGRSSISGSLEGSGTFIITNGSINLTGISTFSGQFIVDVYTNLNVAGTMTNSILTATELCNLSGNGILPITTLDRTSLYPGDNPSPGVDRHAIGILSSNSFAMTSGRIGIDIDGSAPGTDYDQLDVTGTVTLDNPQLRVSLLSLPPVPGSTYVIVANDGTDAVIGTFNGLPEGATFSVDGTTFQITYVGGTGNDIVLTAQGVGPKSWTGAVSNLWSESGNWHTGTAPVDGDVLIFPNGVANQTNTNDIIG